MAIASQLMEGVNRLGYATTTIGQLTGSAQLQTLGAKMGQGAKAGSAVISVLSMRPKLKSDGGGGSSSSGSSSTVGGLSEIIKSVETVITRIETSNDYLGKILNAISPSFKTVYERMGQNSRFLHAMNKTIVGKMYLHTAGADLAKNYSKMMFNFGSALEAKQTSSVDLLMYKLIGKNPIFKKFFMNIDEILNGLKLKRTVFDMQTKNTILTIIPLRLDAIRDVSAESIKIQSLQLETQQKIENTVSMWFEYYSKDHISRNNNASSTDEFSKMIDNWSERNDKIQGSSKKYQDTAIKILKDSNKSLNDLNDHVLSLSAIMVKLFDTPMVMFKKFLGYYFKFKVFNMLRKIIVGIIGLGKTGIPYVDSALKFFGVSTKKKAAENKTQLSILGKNKEVISESVKAIREFFSKRSEEIREAWGKYKKTDEYKKMMEIVRNTVGDTVKDICKVVAKIASVFIPLIAMFKFGIKAMGWAGKKTTNFIHNLGVRQPTGPPGQNGQPPQPDRRITTRIKNIMGDALTGKGIRNAWKDIKTAGTKFKKAVGPNDISRALHLQYYTKDIDKNIEKAKNRASRISDPALKAKALDRVKRARDLTDELRTFMKDKDLTKLTPSDKTKLNDLIRKIDPAYNRISKQMTRKARKKERDLKNEIKKFKQANPNLSQLSDRKRQQFKNMLTNYRKVYDVPSQDIVKDTIGRRMKRAVVRKIGTPTEWVDRMRASKISNVTMRAINTPLVNAFTVVGRGISRTLGAYMGQLLPPRVITAAQNVFTASWTRFTRFMTSTPVISHVTRTVTSIWHKIATVSAGSILRTFGKIPKLFMKIGGQLTKINSLYLRIKNRLASNVLVRGASGAVNLGGQVLGAVSKMGGYAMVAGMTIQMAIAAVKSLFSIIATQYSNQAYDNASLISEMVKDFINKMIDFTYMALGFAFENIGPLVKSLAKGVWDIFKHSSAFIIGGILNTLLPEEKANWLLDKIGLKDAYDRVHEKFTAGKNINIQKEAEKMQDKEDNIEEIKDNTKKLADKFAPKNFGQSLGVGLHKLTQVFGSIIKHAGGSIEKFENENVKFFTEWKKSDEWFKKEMATGFINSYTYAQQAMNDNTSATIANTEELKKINAANGENKKEEDPKSGGFWNKVKSVSSGAWNKVKSVSSGAWNKVKSVSSGAWNKFKDILNGKSDKKNLEAVPKSAKKMLGIGKNYNDIYVKATDEAQAQNKSKNGVLDSIKGWFADKGNSNLNRLHAEQQIGEKQKGDPITANMSYERRLKLFQQAIKNAEGKRNKVYDDGRNNLTIGYGHKLRKNELEQFRGKELTDEEVEALFQKDFAQHYNAVASTKIFQSVKDPIAQLVLADMGFNMGANIFKQFPKFTGYLLSNNNEAAAAELLNSAYASQVKKRARRNAAAIRTGIFETNVDVGSALYSSTNKYPTRKPFQIDMSEVDKWFRPNAKDVTMDKIKALDANLLYAMLQFAKATKEPVPVNSAKRTREEQAALYKAKGPGKAAKPGGSKHETGLAIDINSKYANKYSNLLSRFGLYRPYSSEPWHIELKHNIKGAGLGAGGVGGYGIIGDTLNSAATGNTADDPLSRFTSLLSFMFTGNDGTGNLKVGNQNSSLQSVNEAISSDKESQAKKETGDPPVNIKMSPKMQDLMSLFKSLGPKVDSTVQPSSMDVIKNLPIKETGDPPVNIKMSPKMQDLMSLFKSLGPKVDSTVQPSSMDVIKNLPIKETGDPPVNIKMSPKMQDLMSLFKSLGPKVENEFEIIKPNLRSFAETIASGEVGYDIKKMEGSAELNAAHGNKTTKDFERRLEKPMENVAKNVNNIMGSLVEAFKPMVTGKIQPAVNNIMNETMVSNNNSTMSSIQSGGSGGNSMDQTANMLNDLGLAAFMI